MVTAVREFMSYMEAASTSEQQNPKLELQLILAMQRSLWEFDQSETATREPTPGKPVAGTPRR